MPKFFERPKLKIIIASVTCFIFLLVALIAIACANAIPSKDTQGISATTPKTTEPPVPVAKEPTIYDYLTFEKNETGYTLTYVNGYPESHLLIPAETEDGGKITAIGELAFSKSPTLLEVTIPATVKKIEYGCFVGAQSLVAVNVEPANPNYTSVGGVLFSKNKTELICYPAAKVGESYLLSTNVKKISPYAFHGIKNLKSILYEGSTSKYQSIEIGSGNHDFIALPVTCNYVAGKR